jgi:hypothetical protein
VSLARAVAQTFDGDHRCGLCKGITAVQHSQKKSDVQSVTIKPGLICAPRSITLLPACTDLLCQAEDERISASAFSAHSSVAF